MKKIIILYCLAISTVFAQSEVDSLLNLIQKTEIDTIKARYYLLLSETCEIEDVPFYTDKVFQLYKGMQKKYSSPKDIKIIDVIKASALVNKAFYEDEMGNFDTSDSIYKLALQLFEKHNDSHGIISTLINLGYCQNNNKNNPIAAIEYYERANILAKNAKDKFSEAVTYLNLGYIYYNMGLIEKAIEIEYKGLAIREEIGDLDGIARVLEHLGNFYTDLKEYDKAEEIYLRALEMKNKSGDKVAIGYGLNNLGAFYFKIGDKKKSEEYYEKALQVRLESKNLRSIAYAYNASGRIVADNGDVEKGLEYLKKSVEIWKKLNMAAGLSSAYFSYAYVYFKHKKDFPKAIYYGEEALKLVKDVNNVQEMIDCAELLKVIYENANDYKKAYKMYDLYITLRDSTINEKNQKALIRQNIKYDYEKQKAIDDLENNKKIEIEKTKQKQQFISLIIVIVAALLVTILLLIIYRRLRITRKQKLIIENQKKEVEYQKQKIELAHREITDSITYAKRIQQAILPSIDDVKNAFPESFIYYAPKDVVAGDFYWFENYKNNFYIAAADCTGHGVPGALVSVICSNALNKALIEEGIEDIAILLERVRELVVERLAKSGGEIKDGMDISLLKYNPIEKKAEWVGANNPLYIAKNNEIEIIKGDKQPIGKTDKPLPFTKHTFNVSKNDTFYLFTDGFADQFGGKELKKMGYKLFREQLLSTNSAYFSLQKEKLANYLAEWKGNEEQVDDICIIGVKF